MPTAAFKRRWLEVAFGFAVCAVTVKVTAFGAELPTRSAPPGAPFQLTWITNDAPARRFTVVARGLDDASLKRLAAPDFTWNRLLEVAVEPANPLDTLELPPLLGTHRIVNGAVQFEPRFPLEPGVRYRATFRPSQIVRGSAAQPDSISQVFQLPLREVAPTTVVSAVYPSATELPENLLKFYLHFGAPMSGGQIYHHVHLLNAQRQPVELPFLEIDEELWDPSMTRLTLFIDPGRIKRGVRPLEEIGPALEVGKRFFLVIDRDWKDAAGAPLKSAFEKVFTVGPADREPPALNKWRIVPGEAGTREPLRVHFNEPLDHALAARMLQVKHLASGRRVQGQVQLEDSESRWRFEPDAPWSAGDYALEVEATIEDLAGNNPGKAFEVDVIQGPRPRSGLPVHQLEFVVR